MRRLPVWGFVLLVVVWIALLQTVPRLTLPDGSSGYATFEKTSDITRGLWVTTGLGALIVLLAIGVLEWWRPAFVEDRRLPRWVWVFPVVMLACVLAGTAYSKLADKGAGFTAMLLVGALLVGVSEEGMFRGIGVVTFRQAGFSEGRVAFWTCLMFGLVHATNIVDEGVKAVPQVLVTAFAGYFLYLTRRVSGSLVAAMVVHGLWDFGLFSQSVGGNAGLGQILFVLADLVLAVVAVVTFRRVFPRTSTTEAPAPPGARTVEP